MSSLERFAIYGHALTGGGVQTGAFLLLVGGIGSYCKMIVIIIVIGFEKTYHFT